MVRGELSPYQLGPRLLFPQVALAMQGPGEILDLAAEQPQPRVLVHRGGPVLSLTRVDRREDLILRQAVHGLGVRQKVLEREPVDDADRFALAQLLIGIGGLEHELLQMPFEPGAEREVDQGPLQFRAALDEGGE